jgi:hypothetical protein
MFTCPDIDEDYHYRYSIYSSHQIDEVLIEKINQFIHEDLFNKCELTDEPWITSEVIEKKIK